MLNPVAVGEWELGVDGRTLARCGFDAQTTADHLHAFAHAEQSQSFVPFGAKHPFHLKGPAVVSNGQADGTRKFPDADIYLAGARMAADIRQRFLDDAIEDRACDGVHSFNPARSKGREMNVN